MSVFFFIDRERVELEYFSGFVTSPGKTVEIYRKVGQTEAGPLFYVYDNARFVQTALNAEEMIGYMAFRLHNVHYLLNKKEAK